MLRMQTIVNSHSQEVSISTITVVGQSDERANLVGLWALWSPTTDVHVRN